MNIKDYVKKRIASCNIDQLDCFREMQKENRLTISLSTGVGKGHLMITDILNRLVNSKEKIFVIASHRLMLNTQHMSDMIKDFLPLTGKIGYIFVGSSTYSTSNLLHLREFNDMLNISKIGHNAIISSTLSPIELNEKIENHINEGRKIIIITTYHSLMKLGAVDIDTFYSDETHMLATNSQKADSIFYKNFIQITAKRYFFFTATPKDLFGLREGETTDAFLMNNTEVFGKRIGIKFAEAVVKGYIVEPIIHLVRPSDLIRGSEEFGSDTDKAKFIEECLYVHRDYIKKKSAQPNKIGAKILIKCEGVDEMWILHTLLKRSLPNIKICAGASRGLTGDYEIHGKHYINDEKIDRRDDYLKKLQSFSSEEDAIVLHYDILSEGINVSGFTGVMFLSGMMLTITKILQNIGRATRLHEIDRNNLSKKLISPKDYTKWVKPECAVIIPYWDDTSDDTRKLIAATIERLRREFDFNARLEVGLGDDRGSSSEPDNPETLDEETVRFRDSIVEEIEQEIEGIRVNIYELWSEQRITKLSKIDYFDEILSTL